MTAQTISLDLPEQLYRRLAETADSTRRSLDEVILQSIRVGLPPSVDHFPEPIRTDLHTLDQLSDATLWRIAQNELADKQVSVYEELLEQNQHNGLSPAEQIQLAHLREEADLIMFRSAYAYTLLKWRGHRIPTAAEMQMP